MGGTGKKNEHPNQGQDQSKKPPGSTIEEDDIEDGDMATPKRDRHGDDDEPL